MNRKFAQLAVIMLAIFVSILLFSPSLFVYFVQDDFFLLSISKANNITEFFHFFIPLKEVPWYRPLSSQIFFWLGRLFFGLNPFYFHILVLITHIGTAVALYFLVKEITKKNLLAGVGSFLYVTHAMHFIALSWLASYSFILGSLIEVLILLFYVKKKYLWSIAFFIVGLAATEVHVVLPLVLAGYHFFKNERIPLVRLLFFGSISISLIIFRFIFFPPQSNALYQVSVDSIASTSKFYIEQILGLPMLYINMSFPLMILTIVLLFGFVLALCIGFWAALKSKNKPYWVSFFGVLGLLYFFPFLLLPNHVAPYYLSFSLIGVSVLFSYIIQRVSVFLPFPVTLPVILLIFILLQFINIQWTYRTHWLFRRADLARRLIEQKDFLHPIGSEEYFSLGANTAAVIFEN